MSQREFRDERVRVVKISLYYALLSTTTCQATRPVTLVTCRNVLAFMNCENRVLQRGELAMVSYGGELIRVSCKILKIQDSAGIILNFKILPAES